MLAKDQRKLVNGSIFWQSYSPGHPKRKQHYSQIKLQGTQVKMELVPSTEFRNDVMWMIIKTNLGRTSITPKKGTVTFSIQGERVVGQVQASGVPDTSLEETPNSTYQAEFSGQKGTLLPDDVEGLNSLKIQPNDSWERVVTKAIRLRELGLMNESIASFTHYGEMFASTDATADLYSKIALQFTRQSRILGLEGGVYIYQLVRDGSVAKVGLQVGDIVIEYGGRVITGMNDLVEVQNNASKGKSLSLIYLRLGKDGRFQRRSTTVINPMGAGFMPI
jgi:C-terminal processing protease CtpA/Prc